MPRNNPTLPALTPGVPVLRLTVTISSQNQLYQNILDYIASVPIACNLAVQNAFLTAWRANAEVAWKATLILTNAIQVYTLAEIAQGTCPTLVTQVNLAGTNVGASALNGMISATVDKLTAVKGQHGRGRASFGPVSVTSTTPATDPNNLNAAGIALYNALSGGLLTPVVAGGATWSLGITTRPIRPATLTTAGVPVSLMTVQPTLGTVRRRKEGRGI